MSSSDEFVERVARERKVFSGGTITVYEVDVETKPGVYETLEVVEKAGDSVAVLPIDEQGQVHLIKEYYAGANERLYSLPKGTINEGESAKEAALREMMEEVGLSGDLSQLAIFDLSPGYLRQRTTVFLARNLRTSRAQGDERTYLAPVSMHYDEALHMARTGQLTEARLVAALFLAMPQVRPDLLPASSGRDE
jgi:8-oxo-dGTP pyrophosphatase MutT (NUDIX family)